MTMLVERTPLGQVAEFSRKDGGHRLGQHRLEQTPMITLSLASRTTRTKKRTKHLIKKGKTWNSGRYVGIWVWRDGRRLGILVE